MTLAMNDLNELTRKYYFRTPQAILAMVQCAAEMEDAVMMKQVVDECKRRNIDLPKLLRDDLARHEALWGKTPKRVSGGKQFRSPLQYKVFGG